jgi:tRNA(Ile)-lysidine synthase
MDSFESKVLRTIEEQSLIEPGARLVAAVSGGPDSVALLTVLLRLSSALTIKVVAAHVNHRLRGPESNRDQAFVTELCRRLKTELVCQELESLDGKSPGNLEDKARRRRYDFLCQLAQQQAALLATGHSLNDQAETYLLKLLRGAGPAGLSGILIRRSHPRISDSVGTDTTVVRPLLEVSREEILAYLERNNQEYILDSSNLLLNYDRNWVRHQLMPLLEDRFGSSLSGTLARNSGLFAEIEEYLEEESAQLLAAAGEEIEQGFAIDLSSLQKAPVILQKQALRQAIRKVKGNLLNISQNHVIALLDLGRTTSGKQLHLPEGLRVVKEFGSLNLYQSGRQVPLFSHEFQMPGELDLPEIGKRISARTAGYPVAKGKTVIYPASNRVVIRNRRPGDRYRLSSRSPEKSLKKLFLERKIPISTRDRLIVIESSNRILWIEGFPPMVEASDPRIDPEGFEITVTSETFGLSGHSKEGRN